MTRRPRLSDEDATYRSQHALVPQAKMWSEAPAGRPGVVRPPRSAATPIDDPCLVLDSYTIDSARRFPPAWVWAYYTTSYDPNQTTGAAPYVNGAGTFFLRDMWTNTGGTPPIQNISEVVRLRPVVPSPVDHTTVNRLSLTLGLNVVDTVGADFVGGISVIIQTWSGTAWVSRSTLGDFAAMNDVGTYEYTQLETASGTTTWAQLVGFFNDGSARLAVYAQGYDQQYRCYDMEVTTLCAEFVQI